jgi:hypothetical protein
MRMSIREAVEILESANRWLHGEKVAVVKPSRYMAALTRVIDHMNTVCLKEWKREPGPMEGIGGVEGDW